MSGPGAGDAGPTDPYGARAPVGAEVAKMLTGVALGWFLFHQGWGKVTQEWTGGPGTFRYPLTASSSFTG